MSIRPRSPLLFTFELISTNVDYLSTGINIDYLDYTTFFSDIDERWILRCKFQRQRGS